MRTLRVKVGDMRRTPERAVQIAAPRAAGPRVHPRVCNLLTSFSRDFLGPVCRWRPSCELPTDAMKRSRGAEEQKSTYRRARNLSRPVAPTRPSLKKTKLFVVVVTLIVLSAWSTRVPSSTLPGPLSYSFGTAWCEYSGGISQGRGSCELSAPLQGFQGAAAAVRRPRRG